MNELKILEDLEIRHEVRPKTAKTILVGNLACAHWNQTIIQPMDARQAAIEWIELLEELEQKNQYTKFSFSTEWIKHFFSITEEDLK